MSQVTRLTLLSQKSLVYSSHEILMAVQYVTWILDCPVDIGGLGYPTAPECLPLLKPLL